jgi:hypothetical protein
MQGGYWNCDDVCVLVYKRRPICFLKSGDYLSYTNVQDSYDVLVCVYVRGSAYYFITTRRNVRSKRQS